MPDYDAIVIGAGLTCAGDLARAGLKMQVLERRSVVGGAAVTEEFHPGFRNSVYSYAVSLLHPDVIRAGFIVLKTLADVGMQAVEDRLFLKQPKP